VDCYISADESGRKQFASLIEKPIYSGIAEYVRFFNYENLIAQYEKECALSRIKKYSQCNIK